MMVTNAVLWIEYGSTYQEKSIYRQHCKGLGISKPTNYCTTYVSNTIWLDPE